MNGPAHYREAERVVNAYERQLNDAQGPVQGEVLSHAVEVYALAQVHATLALAAATMVDALDFYGSDDYKARIASWREVVS